MDLLEKIKGHWFVGLVVFACILISSTWYVSYELLVKPRDFEIERLEARIAELQKRGKELQSKVATSSSSDNARVLEPIWVSGGIPIPILSGQVLVTPTDLYIHSEKKAFSIQ
jgi:hypothetical protein